MLGTRALRDRSASHDPEASQPAPTRHEGKEKMKERAPQGGWAEPSLAQKPSHKDHHGGSYYSVSDHMQPLGEAPNARVKARVKADGARKSMLGKGSVGVGVDAQETPEGSPAPQTASQEAADMPPNPRIVVDDDHDGDYAPRGAGKKKERTARPRPVKRPSTAAATTGSAKSKVSTKPGSAPKVVNKNRVYNESKMKHVVEEAKLRAVKAGKPDLAEAVNEIYLNSLTDARLTELLEAILLQSATKAQRLEFSEYVRTAKRKIKMMKETAKTREQRQLSNGGTTNGTQSLTIRSPSKFTSGHGESSALPSTEQPEPSKSHKLSLKANRPPTSTDHQRPTRQSQTPPLKKRAGSVDSDSSLTDLTSNPDDDLDADAPPIIDTTSNAVMVDHAAERGSLAAPRRGNLKRSSAEAELPDDSNAPKKTKLPTTATVNGTGNRNTKRSSAEAELPDDEAERTLATKKQKLGESVIRDEVYPESDVRDSANAAPTRARALRDKAAPSTNGARVTRSGRAISTDIDSPLSELSPASSRQSTPHVPKKATKPTKAAKTKQSPQKKQTTANTGLAGGVGRDSPIGDDDNEELSDNQDFCSSCGGTGFLVCCDGCDRSFHLNCLDPPLSQGARELQEPWFCYVCVSKRPAVHDDAETKKKGGLFGPLLNTLSKRNPSNFSLPLDVREYFEGVGTDKNTGAFVESNGVKTRNRSGYDEVPDYLKIKDNKGNYIHCYSCGKTSQGTRPVIQCDFCSQHWHLDCLDPPLANPRPRDVDGRKLRDWMCPLHADHELRQVDVTRLHQPEGRKVHLRRPRNPKVLDTTMRRGTRNNGLVEVVHDESSDDSDSEFYDDEENGEATILRLPAKGIKLDFIEKVKSTRIQHMRDMDAYRRATTIATGRRAAQTPNPLEQANFSRRSIIEQQTALNLAQFANANEDLGLSKDQVTNLIGTLIAEAPQNVVNQMSAAEEAQHARSASAAIPPSPPVSEHMNQVSAEQRKELEMLQELIRRRLENAKS